MNIVNELFVLNFDSIPSYTLHYQEVDTDPSFKIREFYSFEAFDYIYSTAWRVDQDSSTIIFTWVAGGSFIGPQTLTIEKSETLDLRPLPLSVKLSKEDILNHSLATLAYLFINDSTPKDKATALSPLSTYLNNYLS